MAPDLPAYEERFREAVHNFWAVRSDQAEQQRLKGKLDAGTRGAVTGGKHLDGVAVLIADVFTDAGIPPVGNYRVLPGYYRLSKNWDVVVTYRGAIVAIIELKSQIGSFGNNCNNRIEEMVGQSLDLRRAAREGRFGEIPPWFGYLMLLESSPASYEPHPLPTMAYPADDVFADASYIDRYRVALQRLRLEGDVDAVCLVTSNRDGDLVGYPDRTMTFTAFAAAIQARVSSILAMLGSG